MLHHNTTKLIAACAIFYWAFGLFDTKTIAQTTPQGVAASYPSKPIRLVVPFTPGGSTDILARAIGLELTRAWGQPIIIDNVPGAGGSIGADKAAKAANDGYTLLMGHIGTLAVNPSLYPKLPYNPVKDFTPVAWVARVPNVLVVHPSVPARTLSELVAYAKSQPASSPTAAAATAAPPIWPPNTSNYKPARPSYTSPTEALHQRSLT
jgi:tripartite-type tricarboxylate transporter receptor subunit TctC